MAEPPSYASYDVLTKWASPSFDTRTRAVLAERLAHPPPRCFLSEAEWRLLEAVVARLMPQPDRDPPIPIVPWIDQLLATDGGEGYREDGAPPQQAAWRQGLAAIQSAGAGDFAALPPAAQDAVLAGIQQAEATRRFFVNDLLKQVVTIYYAHPAAWSEIGFGGPASPRGYVRLGFDTRDPWEAAARR